MTSVLRDIYNNVFEFVRTFGAFQLFFLRLIRHAPRMILRRPGLIIKQIYNTGALSLVIIMVCGFFVGGVLALQGYANMARVNMEDSVGMLVALALIKELGPVITALLFAGRAGTALASEIGLMKVGCWCRDSLVVSLPCRCWWLYSIVSVCTAHTWLALTFWK